MWALGRIAGRSCVRRDLTTIGRVEPRPVRASQAALIRWMGITDANSAGFVHGAP